MKKSKWEIGLLVLLCGLFFSCSLGPQGSHDNGGVSSSAGAVDLTPYESFENLNAITNGTADYVPWRVSRAFAVMKLENFRSRTNWQNAQLSERPVVIYDENLRPEYYEFRIINANKSVGAIAANAQKTSGNPIAYVMQFAADYAKILENHPNFKLVAYDYPTKVVCGQISKGNRNSAEIIDPVSGQRITILPKSTLLDFLTNSNTSALSNFGVTNQSDRKALIQEQIENQAKTAGIWSNILLQESRIISLSDKDISDKAKSANRASWYEWYYLQPYADRANWYNTGGDCGPYALSFITWGGGYYPGWNGDPGDNNSHAIQRVYDVYSPAADGNGITWPWEFPTWLEMYTPLSIGPVVLPGKWKANDVKNIMTSTGFPVISLRSSKIDNWQLDPAFHYRSIIGTERSLNDNFFGIVFEDSAMFYMHDNGADGGNFWEDQNDIFDIGMFTVVRVKPDPEPLSPIQTNPQLNSPLGGAKINGGSQNVDLNCSPSINTKYYLYWIRKPDGSSITVSNNSDTLNYFCSETGQYYWNVTSVDINNQPFKSSDTWDFTVNPTAPILLNPVNGTLLTGGRGNVNFTWSSSAGAAGYILYINQDQYRLGNTTNYALNMPSGQFSWQVAAVGYDNTTITKSAVNTLTVQSVWQQLGSKEFSVTSIDNPVLALDPKGTPYVLYSGVTYSGLNVIKNYTVKKYNGTDWQLVGSEGFTSSGSKPKIGFDAGGTPFLLYINGANSSVMKYNGTSWQTINNDRIAAYFTYVQTAIDPSGIPYVVYVDGYGKISVIKYSGGGWQLVGNPGFSPIVNIGYSSPGDPLSIAFDPSGIPYVAFIDYHCNNLISVMKYDGTGWQFVGNQGISPIGHFPALAVDPKGIPYVAFRNDYNLISVMKYDSASWQYVGGYVHANHIPIVPVLEFDPSGMPYVAFTEHADQYQTEPYPIAVMKFNETWQLEGKDGFAGSSWIINSGGDSPDTEVVGIPAFAIDSAGDLIVAYNDNKKISAMENYGSTASTFGIYTETADHKRNGEVPYDSTATLFGWSGTVGIDSVKPGTDGEGNTCWQFTIKSNPWFGAGIYSSVSVNLQLYNNGCLNLKAKSSGSSTVSVGLGSNNGKDQNVTVKLSKYGFVNNGTWQTIQIPISDFYAANNMANIKQYFIVVSDGSPKIGDVFYVDDVYLKAN